MIYHEVQVLWPKVCSLTKTSMTDDFEKKPNDMKKAVALDANEVIFQ